MELQKFAESCDYKVVDRSEAKPIPESATIWVEWVVTDEGSVECTNVTSLVETGTTFSVVTLRFLVRQGFRVSGACLEGSQHEIVSEET